jgi:hypothetical protein
VLIRSTDDGADYYYVGWAQSIAEGRWTVSRRVGDTNTFIANEGSSHALTVGQSYEVEVTVNGSAITVVVDSVTEVETTDANVTANGKVGIYTNGSTSTTGYQVNNISAENI